MSQQLSKDVFKSGFALICAVFKSFDISSIEILYEFLSDLRDDQFIKAVKTFLMETKELYPNTNIIAHIRENAKKQIKKPQPNPYLEMENKRHEMKIADEIKPLLNKIAKEV